MASHLQDVRLETYHNVEITKKAASLQPDEEVNNEFRLVTCAIEKGWFPPGTVSIEILHSPPSLTHEGVQPDASHLNLSIDSGKKHAHLYLDLEGGPSASAATTLVAISFTSSAFPTIARRPTLLQSGLMSPDRKPTPLSPMVEPFVENPINDEDLMITHIPPSPPPLGKLELPLTVEEAGDVSDEIETPQSQEARKDWFLEAKPLVHHERLTHLPLPIPPHTTPLERFMLDPRRIGPSNASAPSTTMTFIKPMHRRTASSQPIELRAPSVGRHRRVASMGADLTKRFSASNLLLDQLWQFGPTCGQRSSSAMPSTVFEVGSDSEGSSKVAAVVIQKDRLWAPGEVLSFAFMEKAVTTSQMNQQQKVKDTVLEWQKYANITFKYIDSVEDAVIRISFDLRGGSWSFVGTEVMDVEKFKPTMNLGWIYGDTDIASDGERGTILHEFGHTLGLLHELQSPDRPKKLALKYDAVIEYYTDALQTSAEEVKAQIWDVFNASELSNYSEFDPKSVMMYFMPASLNEEGIMIPPNSRLSEKDKAFMVINYPSMDKDKATFLGALGTVGITGETRELMLEMFDLLDFGAIRTIFNQFCADARARQSGPSPPQDPMNEVTEPPKEVSSPITPAPQEPTTVEPEPTRDQDELEQDVSIPTGNLGMPTPSDPPPPPILESAKPTKPDKNAPPKPPIRKRRRCANLRPPECPISEEPAIPDACAFDSVMAYRSASQIDEVDYLWRPGTTLTYTWTQDVDQATAYRKQRVRETFEFYAARVNLAFREICSGGRRAVADINIHFGAPSVLRAAGWAFCGASALGVRRKRSEIVEWDGTMETTIMLSDEVLEASQPASGWTKRRETRLLFHQIGHVLGLGHGCRITEANAGGKSHPTGPIFRDEKSIMLHPPPGKGLDGDWKEVKNYFNHLSPKFVYTPSEMDLAFLGLAYPYAQGHVDDRFQDNLRCLGLPVVELSKRRDLAFSHFGKPEFAMLIRNLRIAIKDSSTLFSQYDHIQPFQTNLLEKPPDIHPPAFKTLAPRSFLEKLRDQLQSSLHLSSGQLFALQYPGRPYSFQGTEHREINGTSTKTDDVEKDFHLMDELYDVGSIITSPNGLRLSVVYEQVLNNLVPRLQASQIQFAKHQDQIRSWLSKEVPASDWVKARAASWSSQPHGSRTTLNTPSDPVNISRLELSAALTQEYLTAKHQWELERQSLAQASLNGNIHAATHRIARLSVLREAQLAAKHADAVVRGYSHLIRQYTAYLDIKTPSDILQDAKSDLVASAQTTRDGTTKTYPVQTQPVDWKNSLATNFKTCNLVDHPTFYLEQIEIRSKQVDQLTARLGALSNRSQTNLVKKQQKDVEIARAAFDKANDAVETAFAPNIVFLAKACTNANHEFVMADFVACAAALKLPSTAFLDIERRMRAVTQAQKELLARSRILGMSQGTSCTPMMVEHHQYLSRESTALTERLRHLDADITLLSARLQALLSNDTNPNSPMPNVAPFLHPLLRLDDIPILPPRRTQQDLQWQEFVFQDQFDTLVVALLDSLATPASSNPTPLFFRSSGSNELNAGLDHPGTLQIDVGFRATLVNADRSSWFHPQIFRQSTSFHHLDQRISWSKWPKDVRSIRDLAAVGATEAAAVYGGLNKHLLPAYPVGYMLCKDITIKIRPSKTRSDKLSAELAALLATSAGILCFSTNSSDLSATSGHSYWFQSVSDGCVIRIPGPQILGYVTQFTEPDATTGIPDILAEGLVA